MLEVENKFNANISRTVRFMKTLSAGLNKVAGENGMSFNLRALQCRRYALDNLNKETTQK